MVDLAPDSARVFVGVPGEGVKWFRARPDLDIFTEDGSGPAALLSVIHELIRANFHRLAEGIDLANIAVDFDGIALIQVGPAWTFKVDGEEQSLYVRYEDGDETELHRIDGMEIVGPLSWQRKTSRAARCPSVQRHSTTDSGNKPKINTFRPGALNSVQLTAYRPGPVHQGRDTPCGVACSRSLRVPTPFADLSDDESHGSFHGVFHRVWGVAPRMSRHS